MEVNGNKIIIEFNPNSTQPSKSGKTTVLATSNGFVWIEDEDGGRIGINYNVIRKITG